MLLTLLEAPPWTKPVGPNVGSKLTFTRSGITGTSDVQEVDRTEGGLVLISDGGLYDTDLYGGVFSLDVPKLPE